MRQILGPLDPSLPAVKAEAVRSSQVIEQILALADTLDAHGEKLGEATASVAGTATILSKCSAQIREIVEAHVSSLLEHTGQQSELRELIVAQSALLKCLELRLPDPQKVRQEIQSDLWLAYEGRVLDNAKKVEQILDEIVRQAAAKMIDSLALGLLPPAHPPDGSPIRHRCAYFGARIRFRIRKFATDWLPVTLLVGVVFLASIFATLACIFAVVVLHRPLPL